MTVARSAVPEEVRSEDPPMTSRQKEFLLSLINEREMSSAKRSEAFRRISEGLTRKQASEWIDRALLLPKGRSEFAHINKSLPNVLDGRYAVMVSETVASVDVETLKFFKVKKPTEGKWAGFTFLDAGRGGSHGDLQWTPVKNLDYKLSVLRLIAKDPEAAGKKFGQEVGVCCRCGLSLTNETSRALGIGPDCAKKGW